MMMQWQLLLSNTVLTIWACQNLLSRGPSLPKMLEDKKHVKFGLVCAYMFFNTYALAIFSMKAIALVVGFLWGMP